MKIGIVSAQKHCKTHLQALQRDGYDVTCLGPRPTSIPPSYDALVIRIASIRHAASDVVRRWEKDTGKPVIYEDGLSGIRRGLTALSQPIEADTPADDPAIDKTEVRQWLENCAEAFCDARPNDGHGELTKALTRVIYDQYPKRGRDLVSMVPSIVSRHFVPPTLPAEEPMPTTTLPPYIGGTTPSDKAWSRVYTEPNIRRGYDEAVGIIKSANHMTISAFVTALESGTFSTKVQKRWRGMIEGNPLAFAFVALMLCPGLTKKQVGASYKIVTGKGMDTRLSDVVGWALGWDGEVEVADTPSPTASPDAVESNTEAILTLMDDLSTFKKEIRAEVESNINRAHGQMAAGIKALEERVTQVRLDQITDSDIGNRIKALEMVESARLTGDDVSLMAGMEARKAVEAMGEELRSDISNAFDALAAEAQSASNPASNPLAALEQVKAALKAAGFTGTLTLTIE
jgi:hypothetical protein